MLLTRPCYVNTGYNYNYMVRHILGDLKTACFIGIIRDHDDIHVLLMLVGILLGNLTELTTSQNIQISRNHVRVIKCIPP